MSSLLALIALPLIAGLALFAPTGCGCRLDLHGGDPLHPVFDHPHPHTPTDTDGLAASEGGTQLQTTHALATGGPFLVAGQVLPRRANLLLVQPIAWLAPSSVREPSSLSSPPRDPPPRPA